MATDDKPAPAKSQFKRQLEADLAKMLNSKAWKDSSHAGHLAQVTKVYNAYKKAHGTK